MFRNILKKLGYEPGRQISCFPDYQSFNYNGQCLGIERVSFNKFEIWIDGKLVKTYNR